LHYGTIDVREILFHSIHNKHITARITVEREGVIAGSKYAREKLAELGVKVEYLAEDGAKVLPDDVVAAISGTPKQITSAEDAVIGNLTKTSGIATASTQAVKLADGKIRIVSGAWKKMPLLIKHMVREAVAIGGAAFRIADTPFVYLDKNYVRIFNKSIPAVLKAAKIMPDRLAVIQLRGETGSIGEEVAEAAAGGADILMIDTGKHADAVEAIKVLNQLGIRQDKQVAFAGGVQIEDIPDYARLGIDILDIGSRIIDAPLLDMKMDVINT